MLRTPKIRRVACGLLILPLIALPGAAQRSGDTTRWVTTWATALVEGGDGRISVSVSGGSGRPVTYMPVLELNNQTLRQIVHVSAGGSRVRVVLSNAFGPAPLVVGAAHIAVREKDANIVAGTGRSLTFAGRSTVTIPARAVMVSDDADLRVDAQADLAIDLYVPGYAGRGPSPLTGHTAALQTSYVSETGNHTGAETMPVARKTQSWFWLARVEVAAAPGASTVVAFGDSITDGNGSQPDTNSRWPDELAKRLAARPGTRNIGVANAGIGGNQLLLDPDPGFGVNALARFDRDVLAQAGVAFVIVLEGVNDIGRARADPSPSAADLIAAHRQLIERARARGLKIYGATLTPFEGALYWTKEGEAKRQALNDWIRTSGAYDAVIDFEAAVRDPQHPTQFLPQYSSDHLHANSAGYKAMAEAIDLRLFEPLVRLDR